MTVAVPDGDREPIGACRVHLMVDVVPRGALERVAVAGAHHEAHAANAHHALAVDHRRRDAPATDVRLVDVCTEVVCPLVEALRLVTEE